MKKWYIVAALMLAVTQLFAVDPNNSYTDRRAPSQVAPVDNPPMLIALSSDDNFNIEGMEWMIETLRSRKHRDGSCLRMSFYSNTEFWLGSSYVNKLYGTFLQAYKMGNEVTSHTASHVYCVNGDTRLSNEVILDELERSIEDLASIGIKKEHMAGFRTPYVTYTDSTFIALKKAGFTYDASINDGMDLTPGEYNWPYTLDTPNSKNLNEEGMENPPGVWDEATLGPAPLPAEPSYAPGNHLAISYNNYMNGTPIRKHSGLWELPLYAIRVPDSLIAPLDSSLGYGSGGICMPLVEGLLEQGKFTKERALESLKHHFKEVYNGNRAPMVLVLHTPNFSITNHNANEKYPNCSDPINRQWIIEQFIDFALEQEDVWFVSGEQVINFCKRPVSVDLFHPDNFSDIPIDTIPLSIVNNGVKPVNSTTNFTYSNRTISISFITPQETTVSILSLSGRKIVEQQSFMQAGSNQYAIPWALSAGTYIVQVAGAEFTQSMKITLQ